MPKLLKDEKNFKSFKKYFSCLFDNQNFQQMTIKHFDWKLSFAGFIIGFLANQYDKKLLKKHLEININEWNDIFSIFYCDKKIEEVKNNLELNPIVSLEILHSYFQCFDKFIDALIAYLSNQLVELNVDNKDNLFNLFKSGLSYILYNYIDMKIPYNISDILHDHEYDIKYQVIVINTKLFSELKQNILLCCGKKINDFISLVLGMSNRLNEEIN